jgi:endoglucanase
LIGAKPPHLLTPADAKKVSQFEDLFIDIGFGGDKAKQLVRVGDPVVFNAKPIELQYNRMASKTMDDRACVASEIVAMEILQRLKPNCQAYFVSASSEEVGGKGARVAAYSINPDFAIAMDVCHAETPGTGKWEANPIDKPTVLISPNCHPALVKKAEEAAKKWNIGFTKVVFPGPTPTDGSALQIAHAGVPTIVFGLPLRYMHTTVETLKLDAVEELGKWVAAFIDEVASGWEDIKWY